MHRSPDQPNIQAITDVDEVLEHIEGMGLPEYESERMQRIGQLLMGNLAYIFNISPEIINLHKYEQRRERILENGREVDPNEARIGRIARHFGIHILQMLRVHDQAIGTILGMSYRTNKTYYDGLAKAVIAGTSETARRLRETARIVVEGINREVEGRRLGGPSVATTMDGPAEPSMGESM